MGKNWSFFGAIGRNKVGKMRLFWIFSNTVLTLQDEMIYKNTQVDEEVCIHFENFQRHSSSALKLCLSQQLDVKPQE